MQLLSRKLALFGTALLAFGSTLSADVAASAPAREEKVEISQEDISKISEAFGHFIGRNLNTPGVKLDIEAVVKGIRDGVAGKSAPMTDKDYEEKMLKLQKVAYAKIGEDNLKAANDFLKENATKPNVVVVEPGKLQYQILEAGKGAEVQANGNPLINYSGKYIDGTLFGSSEEVGGPINIPLDQTIPGFSKGIQGMKEGEKRRLFVHPDLGYGTLGHLPPNSLLIFDIEVVKADTPRTNSAEDDELLPLTLDDELDDEEDDDDLDVKKDDQKKEAAKVATPAAASKK
jgi:peptidylprolyl isomerase